ncbi:MAG: hypothetical protein KDE27_16070 [Planctomycetes bacterium]|nr:hypothetical protein [Planctomycetota bacterium]
MRIHLGVLFTTATVVAQTVHTVGPGGFAQIADAIAAAAPDDVIEVQAGYYTPFVLDKALTIRAAPGARVSVLPSGADSVRIMPPAGTVAALARIEFLNPWRFFLGYGVRVERGTAWFEDCVFESPYTYQAAALTVDHSAAVLRGCVIAGFGVGVSTAGTENPGLLAEVATVLATDCIFAGSNTTFDSYGGGGPGIAATTSDVHLVRCEVYGGDQLHVWGNPAAAGIRSTNSNLWLADCDVEGGASYQTGGVGVVQGWPVPVRTARTTIAGGPGLNGGTTGAAVQGAVLAAPLLGLDADPTPLVRGGTFALAFRTEPNWPVAVVLAPDVGPTTLPELAEPAGVPPATTSLLALLVADSSGAAPFQTAIPAGPALLGAHLFVTGVAGASLPLQTAPPVGGLVW